MPSPNDSVGRGIRMQMENWRGKRRKEGDEKGRKGGSSGFSRVKSLIRQ